MYHTRNDIKRKSHKGVDFSDNEPYCLGRSIVVPDIGVRYVMNEGDKKPHYMMYHAFKCNKTGVTGHCIGHEEIRQDFIDTYCNGIEPEQLEEGV